MLLHEYLDKTSGFGTVVGAGKGLFNQTKTYKEIEVILVKYGYEKDKPKCTLSASFTADARHNTNYRFNASVGKLNRYKEYPNISVPFDFSGFPLCCGAQWFAGWANISFGYCGFEKGEAERIIELAVEYFFLCHMYIYGGKPLVCIGTSLVSDHDRIPPNFAFMRPYIVGGPKNRLEFKNLGYGDHGLDVVLLAHPLAHQHIVSKEEYTAAVRQECVNAQLEI